MRGASVSKSARASIYSQRRKKTALIRLSEPLDKQKVLNSAPTISTCQHPSDRDLMQAVADGDSDARQQLAVRLLPRVRRLGRAILAGWSDWEDAVQTSMMEIMRAAGGYHGRSPVERWSDRITVRTCLRLAGEQRQTQRRHGQELDLEAVPARSAPEVMAKHDVERYLSSLSEKRRTVVVLRHVFDYSINEIAELTKASPNTVKDRLLNARRQLRSALRRDERQCNGGNR